MGSRSTRIGVPVIGLLAVAAALAVVASAPVILFPTERHIRPPALAPSASGEVTRVTAPRPPESKSTPPSAPAPPVAPVPATTPTLVAAARVSPDTGEQAGGLPPLRSPTARTAPSGDEASDDVGTGKGKAEGHEAKQHGKWGGHGLAKGHEKEKAQGKAKGHHKPVLPPRLAFDPPRGPKPHHVDPPRAGKHAGRGPRAHARARG